MMSYSLNKLYAVVGISKQAVHGYAERQLAFMKAVEGLRLAVDAYLEDHGGCGLTKLYWTLQPAFLGRDRFIELFQSLGYGFKLKRSPKRTTYSGIFSYQNLIEGLLVTDINQVWQTDITYILAKDRYYYAVFIIDVYSKRILGYQVSNHMYTTANLKALKKSFKVRKASHFPNLIHHSDRGSQYGAKLYTEALSKANIHISMGRSAQENAYAERVNGIIKNEYLTFNSLATFKDVKRELIDPSPFVLRKSSLVPSSFVNRPSSFVLRQSRSHKAQQNMYPVGNAKAGGQPGKHLLAEVDAFAAQQRDAQDDGGHRHADGGAQPKEAEVSEGFPTAFHIGHDQQDEGSATRQAVNQADAVGFAIVGVVMDFFLLKALENPKNTQADQHDADKNLEVVEVGFEGMDLENEQKQPHHKNGGGMPQAPDKAIGDHLAL
jgi:putative transposase